ncbi:MAG: CDP-glycerol glycerophosphotransferase family protein [Chloroflexota bacterium]
MTRFEFVLAGAVLRLLGWIFSLLPIVADRVVLASPRTTRLEGNLRHIHDALRARHPAIRPIVLVEPYAYGLRGKIAYFARMIRGMYYLRTARLFVVDNAYLPIHVAPHRAGTRVVQVWHAASAIKRFGLDTVRPPAEPERTFLHRYYDNVIVSAEAVRPVYARSLRTPLDRVLPLGTPRTDFFFDEAAMAEARARLLAAHPALAGRKVVVHAPTLRGRGRAKSSAASLDPVELRSRLPAEYALVLKLHPNIAASALPPDGFDVLVEPTDEMNPLLALTDILITDYSSAVFEFALVRRPIILLLGDLDEYARDPGVCIDLATEMVGAQVTDTDGVADAILADRFDLSGYDAFLARHMDACDGRASARFVDYFEPDLTGASTRS